MNNFLIFIYLFQYKFSVENAFSRNDRNQSCKRQLSMCSNESIMSNRPSDSTALSDEIHYDATDSSSQYSIKRKCLNSHFKAHSNVKLMPPPTPLSSIKTSKSFESDLTQATESSIDLVKHCNSFFYSKCRDLLDDLIQSNLKLFFSILNFNLLILPHKKKR
jgi:hypothetical protein